MMEENKMSNCVRLHEALVIPLDAIDADGFMAKVRDRGGAKEEPPGPSPKAICPMDTFWWFLTPGNVSRMKDNIVVELGGGRSSHTWRDLGTTLREIASHMRKPVTATIELSDESDGFASTSEMKVTLRPGGGVDGL